MPRFDVTIAGELNLDVILYGLPPDLEPERELLADDMVVTLGSSSAIVAHNLAALGSRVGFASCIGEDAMGRIALARLSEGGVDVSRVCKRASSKTGITAILHHGSWRHILTYLGTISELRFEDLDIDYLTDSRHFHLSSFYLQRNLRPHVPRLLKKLKDAGLTISLDTNDDPDDGWGDGLQDALRYVDVLLPNEREAKRMAREDQLDAAISKLSKVVPLVVVKMGSQGAIAQRGDERFLCAAVTVTPVDPVGAGDSFDAGFLSQYVSGSDVSTCLRHGNLAGAFSTTQPGGTEAFRDRGSREGFWIEHGLAAKVP
jgi:sugar/nucleoside kinase (ribokinase family)